MQHQPQQGQHHLSDFQKDEHRITFRDPKIVRLVRNGWSRAYKRDSEVPVTDIEFRAVCVGTAAAMPVGLKAHLVISSIPRTIAGDRRPLGELLLLLHLFYY